MENLTKQQIVLVTLLVSFVTSIATGIVTVSLMDQAPPGMTQTINRVVERTIERVVQAPSQASVITKETVVVKEDDLVVASIEQNAKSIVRIVYTDAPEGSALGLGIILSKDGLIIADSMSAPSGVSYSARLSDGSVYSLKQVYETKDGQLALFKTIVPEGEKMTFPGVYLADSNKIKLGQAVVFIGGREDNIVETGLISNIEYEKLSAGEDQASTTAATEIARKVVSVSLNVTPKSSVGGILTNLSSEIVALELSREFPRFLPSNYLASALNAYMGSIASSSTPVVTP